MQLKYISSLLVILTFSVFALAKDLGMEISYAEFQDENDQAYLEIYFALHGPSIDFIQTEKGTYIGGVEVTVTLGRDSAKIDAADKFRLLSPEIKDTLEANQLYIHQVRFPVQKGTYTLGIDIQDVNEAEEHYSFKQEVTTTMGDAQLASSEIILLDKFEKTKDQTAFSKSGYNLIPLVTSGTPFYNPDMNTFSFYTEIYNTLGALGEDEPYVVKYYIEDASRNNILNEYASFSRKTAGEIEPILASFSIDNLPSGNYQVHLQVLNREGEVMLEKSKFFYRQGTTSNIDPAEITDEQLANSFVNKLGGLDSIYLYIKYLQPISTDAEQESQKNILSERDLTSMKNYFYAFWARQNPTNPEGAWIEYHDQVKIANKYYKTRIRPGYLSDRGRVFLVYGKPTLVDQRPYEPNLPPYEIWQYNDINTPYAIRQNNKIFIFAEFSPSTNDYELFHSTAIGELASRRWRYDMALRYAGMNGDIDSDVGGNNDFGTRTNNNIILNSTGSDRQNR